MWTVCSWRCRVERVPHGCSCVTLRKIDFFLPRTPRALPRFLHSRIENRFYSTITSTTLTCPYCVTKSFINCCTAPSSYHCYSSFRILASCAPHTNGHLADGTRSRRKYTPSPLPDLASTFLCGHAARSPSPCGPHSYNQIVRLSHRILQ